MTRLRRSDQVIVGLDIGTTKICAVVGEVVKDTLTFRGMHTSPSTGMRKGIVVNMEEMVQSIRKALKETESSFGLEINTVYAGISGAHIKGFPHVGTAGIGGREVTCSDIDHVLNSAQAVYLPLDREVIHVIPAGYAVDGQNGITNPVGMTAERLEARVYAVTGAVTPIQNLLRCCEKAGVEVAGMVFAPVASADAVLSEAEKELGVALVDIGGGTTDIIFYRDGGPVYTSVLAVGGNHFTNDIAVGLKIPSDDAERIKKSFSATAIPVSSESGQEEIMHGGKKRMIAQRNLIEILHARTDEFLDLVRREFLSCSGYDVASTGVVLTGGGALLEGLVGMAEQAWGLPVRLGSPVNIHGIHDTANNPCFATGAGLMLYGFDASADSFCSEVAVIGLFGKMKDWAKEIFKIKKGGIEYVRN